MKRMFRWCKNEKLKLPSYAGRKLFCMPAAGDPALAYSPKKASLTRLRII
ncbi:hypothetical protein [uncultured Merdimonas sp.]